MPVNEAAENILATIGKDCLVDGATRQVIVINESNVGPVLIISNAVPQVVKSFREKSTEGLSPWLMFIWALSAPFLGVYAIVQNISIPIILQPQLFGALAALSWIQCLYYGCGKSKTYCAVLYVLFMAAVGGFEAGLSLVVRASRTDRAGDEWPTRVFGIMSALLIALGLLPQYWEIWKRKEVVGISMLFMTTDMMGGVFSVLSLVFQSQFDAVAAVSYILVVVLDGVVVIAAVILNPIAKQRRRREAEVVAARSVSGDLEAGAPLHEGQIALAEAVAAVQSRQNSGRGSERSPTMPVMKEVDHDEP